MPWEVEALPDEWMDVFNGMVDELPEVTRMVNEQENTRQEWLKKNEYRKYAKK